jgi:hypothetical protein
MRYLIAILCLAVMAVGCQTTTTYPDGRVEVEELSPAALALLEELVDAIIDAEMSDGGGDADSLERLETLAVALLPADVQQAALDAIRAVEDNNSEALLAALQELMEARQGADK